MSMGYTSIIKESIFENRFKYLDELRKMGGVVTVEGNIAIIEGVQEYQGASVTAPDLRAGAALVIAALAADGFSTVDQIQYIERGYEDFPEKLASLGGRIRKVTNPEELKKARLRAV